VRIGQKGRTRHVWWRRGDCPRGLADKRFTFACIFAAIEPGTDNAVARVMPYVTTEAMQLFLDRFAETIDEDEHVAETGRITALCSYPWIPQVE